MNEQSRKRREWVKTAAIIFLSVMLVLTFFSQTIMNYSLPEVAAQYIESGSITAKIRGTGTVESGDPYEVEIKGTRKVESVEVRAGDTVQKGDVICLLSAEESPDLEAAQAAVEAEQENLDSAQDAYDSAMLSFEQTLLLDPEISDSVLLSAGAVDSLAGYRSQILDARAQQQVCEIDVEQAQYVVDTLGEQYDEKLKAANDEVTRLQGEVTEWTNWLNAIDSQLAQEQAALQVYDVSSGDADAEAAAHSRATIDSLNRQRIPANQNKISYESALAQAQREVERLESERSEAPDMKTANEILAQKQKALEEAQQNMTLLLANIGDSLTLRGLYSGVQDAQERIAKARGKLEEAQQKLEKLKLESQDTQVTAPISGTITSLYIKSGLDTPDNGIVATMQPEGEGYTLSFSVTNDQAKTLSPGDMAEPVNYWRYGDMQIILDSIKPDPNNPGQNRLVTFNVTGESVVAGQSLSVSVGQRSANYDMIVPNSAIREDNNGKFILTVESKSSPLGNRYVANRVDVEVVASDDTKSAITGGLYGYEFVITTSTKPVEAGQQVRLANN